MDVEPAQGFRGYRIQFVIDDERGEHGDVARQKRDVRCASKMMVPRKRLVHRIRKDMDMRNLPVIEQRVRSKVAVYMASTTSG